jgi:hypothetical protein
LRDLSFVDLIFADLSFADSSAPAFLRVSPLCPNVHLFSALFAMSTPPDPMQPTQLSASDAQAMEAFVHAGWVGTGSPRDEKIARLLSTLSDVQVAQTLNSDSDGPPGACPATLADRTFEAVLQLRSQEEAGAGRQTLHGDEPTLSELDLEAVDALMLEGLQVKRVPSSLRERASKVHALMSLASSDATPSNQPLSFSDASSQADLVQRTLARVEAARKVSPIMMPEPVRTGRVPMREIASIAAVLVIGGATVWPMAAAASSARSRSMCESNMASLASAFTRYGADFRGLLPVASNTNIRRQDANAPWWNVGGDPRTSNSANLFTIHTARYAPIDASCCPGNEQGCRTMTNSCQDWSDLGQVSYSYFVMFGEEKPTWDGNGPNTTVILADRSPVIRRAVAGQAVSVGENSDNHAGKGQRVLRVDGSSDWLASPYDAGPGRNTGRRPAGRPVAPAQRLGTADNIWLPVSLEETLLQIRSQQERGATQGVVQVPTPEQATQMRSLRLRGTETPGSAGDAFLGP